MPASELQPAPTAAPARAAGRVHVVGAGPVGLFLAALLQTVPGQSVRLYERRDQYTRTRMVSLAPYLIAESIESYQADSIDGESVAALFEPDELETRLAYRRTLAPDLRELLEAWTRGFVSLMTIETSLSELIAARADGGGAAVERVAGPITADEAIAMLEPGDVLVDCTGTHSVLRDRLLPGADPEPPAAGQPGPNTARFRLEYALVITFLYDQHYECNEFCKFYKNAENPSYKFIPAVHRTFYDGSISHVTGIVTISREEFEEMPPRFDGAWLREHFPAVAESMDRVIDKIRDETQGENLGDHEITRNPLDDYHARNATSRRWRESDSGGPLAEAPVFLLGDAALGSPYFQSISLGFECAFFLAGHLANRTLPIDVVLERYEAFMYRQWLRVYMRTRTIKNNKDLLESVGDPMGLLAKLHVY
jgi:2-polyprenyl-6-methoxyphenol hydroxylase-like FAD-dependent oxidoreductase